MKRRKFTSKFKTKVVLESLSERYTMSELAEKHKLNPNQISQWKRQFLDNAEQILEKGKKHSPQDEAQAEKNRLLKKIGDQKVELDFLKNALR